MTFCLEAFQVVHEQNDLRYCQDWQTQATLDLILSELMLSTAVDASSVSAASHYFD